MKGYLILIVFVCMSILAMGHGEGPSDSGNWVYGTVAYGDGSKCRKCCGITLETAIGFSKEGCTNEDGEYKIYIASRYVKVVYYDGKAVWKGSEDTKGGVRIDIRAK